MPRMIGIGWVSSFRARFVGVPPNAGIQPNAAYIRFVRNSVSASIFLKPIAVC